MYSIELPTGTILQLPPALQFSFELQNSIFTGSDISSLPGNFSFPVPLPATGFNLAAFNLPHLPTSANPISELEGVWVRAHNVRMFYGTLKLRRAGSDIEINIEAKPLSSLKTTSLNDLELGGVRTFGSTDLERQALMKAQAEDPENYDFAFPQIYAPHFWSTPPSYVTAPTFRLVNRYDRVAEDYVLDGGPVVPMFRLDYVLQQLVENGTDGWKWTNDWQTDNELRRLYLYNHYDLHDDIEGLTLPDEIDPKNHVSDTAGNEILKKVAATFCLGLFTNIFSREIKIKALNPVLSAAPQHDWTAYAVGGASVEYEDTNAPERFIHPPQSGYRTFGDKVSRSFDLSTMVHYRTRDLLDADQGTIPDGNYYVEADEAVYYMRTLAGGGGQSRTFMRRVRSPYPLTPLTLAPELEAPMDVLLSYRIPDGAYLYHSPEWRGEGNYIDDPDTPGTYERHVNDNPDALFFYRGMQVVPGSSPNPTPYAGVIEDQPAGNGNADIVTSGIAVATAQRSLLWPGTAGLYENNFKRWHDMIKIGRPVTYQLLLPIHRLVSFSFEHKVRILNMDYFVRKLRIQRLTSDGKFVVEAQLFSVI